MIFIDYNDKRPIYEQIIDRFQTLIVNGALEPNMQLPSVRSLAIDLSINANTIQRAYSELEREGYIYSVKDAAILYVITNHLPKSKKQNYYRI